jgi:hypothetical protein
MVILNHKTGGADLTFPSQRNTIGAILLTWKAAPTVAQRTIVQLTDDLDGRSIPDGKGGTVRFGLDRQDYEIDLSDKNAKALRETFRPYVDAARRAGGTTRGGKRRGGRSANGQSYDAKTVRAWAESQGIEVNQRGRVPADLVARFQEANV